MCFIAGGVHFNDLNEVMSARLSNVKLLFPFSVFFFFSKRYIFFSCKILFLIMV